MQTTKIDETPSSGVTSSRSDESENTIAEDVKSNVKIDSTTVNFKETKEVKKTCPFKLPSGLCKIVSSKIVLQYSLLLAFNLIYMLLYVFKIRLLSVLCNLAIVVISVGGLASSFKHTPNGKADVNLDLIDSSKVSELAVVLAKKLNQYLSYFRRVLLWRDFIESTRIVVLLYLLGFVFKYVPFSFVLYVVLWALYLYKYLPRDKVTPVLDFCSFYLNFLSDGFDQLCNKIPKMKDVGKEL